VHPISANSWWLAAGQRVDIIVTLPRWRDLYPLLAIGEGEHGRQCGIVVVTNEQPPAHHHYSVHPSERVHDSGYVVGLQQEMGIRSWFPLHPEQHKALDKEFVLDVTHEPGSRYELAHPGTGALRALQANQFRANSAPLLVKTNQRVCIRLENKNQQVQSVHLHGHYFQVVEMAGTQFYGPIRDTVLIPPGDSHAVMTVTICFEATNPGLHALHSNLWHGMYTTVEYEH